MEAVRAFNNELSSLYETRPPISRAKMANVTKCAIKAIKFYKHVVQSVEKFIQKCKPEYKVPGLYVIDSIVRQSRHQFGPDKDVFAPRFTKNVVVTFQNLFKCPPEEKSKIVRVLNLWQKNGVFMSEIIQPLLDLASDHNNQQHIAAAQRAVDGVMIATGKPSTSGQAQGVPDEMNLSQGGEPDSENSHAAQTEMLNTVTQLLQQTQQGSTSLNAQQQQLQQLQLLQQQLIQQTQLMQQPSQGASAIDNNLLSHIQTLTNQLLKSGDKPPEPGFNKKLLDFDYGESDDEDSSQQQSSAGNVQSLLTDPNIMQQIQQMSQTIQKNEQLNRQKLLEQQAEFDQQIGQLPMNMQPALPPEPQPPMPMQPAYPPMMADHPPPPHFPPQDIDERETIHIQDEDERRRDRDRSRDKDSDRKHRRSKHSRDRSRSRTPKKRRRSRSRSRDRRRRSRSRDRHRRSRSRDRERDRQRERERERRKKGLPPIKEQSLSICSTTLFIGKVAKITSEEELREELEKYGSVESINMIPPRGCAFVVMTRRKEASKAVDRMKGMNLNGSELRVAWAPGIGVKESEFRDKFNVEVGATYLPWDKLPEDLTSLIDGGIIDEDTLPEHLKGTTIGREKPDISEDQQQQQQQMQPQQQLPNNTPQAPLPQLNLPPGPPPGAFPPQIPGMMPQGAMMPRMGMMPPLMVQGGLPPGQMPGMTQAMTQAMTHTQMAVTPGMPPQAPGMIPLPSGLPPTGLQVRPPVSVGVVSTVGGMSLPQSIQNIVSSGNIAIGSQQMLAVQRQGFPPQGFPRFALPPQGFLRPPPNFDQSQQEQSLAQKPSLLGVRPPFEAIQSNEDNKDKPSILGRPPSEWQPKQSSFNETENLDKDERDSQSDSSAQRISTPQGNQAAQENDMSGQPPNVQGQGVLGVAPMIRGLVPGQMRPPNSPMGPQGLRVPRPLMDFNNLMGSPNMGPRGPQDGQNRFGGPNSMRGPGPRGFNGPLGPRQAGFMANRPGNPFPPFPGQFMRPGFRGPPPGPGDMRPRFNGPSPGDDIPESDGPMDESFGADENDKNKSFGSNCNSGEGWDEGGENDSEDFQDDDNFRRDFRRDKHGGSRGRGGRGRDFGGRGRRSGEYDRRDRRDDRYRDDRDRNSGRDRDRERDRDRDYNRDRDREGRRDRDRDDGYRDRHRDRDRGGDRRDRDNDRSRGERRKSNTQWENIEELMKTVSLPPASGSGEEPAEDKTNEPKNEDKPVEPVVEVSKSIVSDVECNNVANGDSVQTEEDSVVKETKEEKVLDLEEGEIE